MKPTRTFKLIFLAACLCITGCGGDPSPNSDEQAAEPASGSNAVIYIRLTNETIKSLISGCKKYHYNTGQHVSNISDFKSPPSGMSKAEWKGPYLGNILPDAWNNEFSIESTPENVVVRSAGPNGIRGDADDITQEWTPDTTK